MSPCGDDEHDEGVSKIVAFTYNVKILERGITESGRRDVVVCLLDLQLCSQCLSTLML